jgi:hypothetical protein
LHVGVTGETVTAVVVKGLIERDAAGASGLDPIAGWPF